MSDTASEIIEKLKLAPLPLEGGFFNEIYRSAMSVGNGDCCGTSIYYLLRFKCLSDWHMVTKDEIWYYHAGSPAVQMLLFADGRCEERIIGPEVLKGHSPQSVIPAGTWQSAKLLSNTESDWGLFGAAVFPGFEFKDYNPGDVGKLCGLFPSCAERIRGFSR